MIRTLTYSLLLVLGGLITLGLVIRNNSSFPSTPLVSDLDSFMIQVTHRYYNPQGLLVRQLKAPTVKHYSSNNTTTLQNPTFQLYTQEGSPPWQLTAKHGKSSQGISEIDLWSNVVLQRAGNATLRPVVMTTEFLTVLPHQNLAQSAAPVVITQLGNQIKGVGLSADFTSGLIRLLSESRGTYAKTAAS